METVELGGSREEQGIRGETGQHRDGTSTNWEGPEKNGVGTGRTQEETGKNSEGTRGNVEGPGKDKEGTG